MEKEESINIVNIKEKAYFMHRANDIDELLALRDDLSWKFAVVGNIVKSHYDKDGILRYGTVAYAGGTKVFLCGHFWDWTRDSISVIGLNRFKEYRVNDVPVELIENVRCQRVYKPSVLHLMNYFEFYDCWWHRSKEDMLETKAFVKEWNARFGIQQRFPSM